MKNKKKKIIIMILVIVIAIIGIFITYKYIGKKSNPDKSLLAISSYSNYAWSTTFNGVAIFDDGTIYSWNYKEKTDGKYDNYIENNDLETQSGMKNFVIDKGSIKLKKVLDDDLKQLKKYINNIKDEDVDYEQMCLGADMGTTSISIYKDEKKYTLSTSGDCEGQSKTENATKILDIINKYS